MQELFPPANVTPNITVRNILCAKSRFNHYLAWI